MSTISTPDLFDENRDNVNVAEMGFTQYGGVKAFCGQAVTVACPMDNSMAVEAIKDNGEGKVLIIDAGQNKNFAFLGDIMADKAINNGWAGIIINGCVRDIEILRDMPLGVTALGVIPRSTVKKGRGLRDIPVALNGLVVEPGDYIYSDENGVIQSKIALL